MALKNPSAHCFRKFKGLQLTFQVVFLDDYSRGYVFCDLFREVTTCITIEAMIVAMRQWQVIPKQVLLDNAGPFRGQLLAAFC